MQTLGLFNILYYINFVFGFLVNILIVMYSSSFLCLYYVV